MVRYFHVCLWRVRVCASNQVPAGAPWGTSEGGRIGRAGGTGSSRPLLPPHRQCPTWGRRCQELCVSTYIIQLFDTVTLQFRIFWWRHNCLAVSFLSLRCSLIDWDRSTNNSEIESRWNQLNTNPKIIRRDQSFNRSFSYVPRVSEKLQLRITDAALSRDLFPTDYESVGAEMARPIKWMAYEVINDRVISASSDVVSQPHHHKIKVHWLL